MTFPLSLPKNLLIAARPATGLSLIVDAMIADLLQPIGQCVLVGVNDHEAQHRLEQFRRHEKLSHPDSKLIRTVATVALNTYKTAEGFAEAVERKIAAGKWAQPCLIVHDRSGDLPLGRSDEWLQFLPELVRRFRANIITAVSSGGSGNDLPEAAQFDEVWTLTPWANPDQRTPSFESEVQLIAGKRKPVIFAARDVGNMRVYSVRRENQKELT